MVIDSSAVIAILHGEPEAHAFVIKLAAATKCRLSAANYVEAGLVLRRDATGAARRALETLLADFQIVIEPVSANQAKLALAAYDRFGKGTGHSAGLNYGDCFAYALAQETGEPLLFKGNDFIHTDLERA
jgi:ribonuclease VapC